MECRADAFSFSPRNPERTVAQIIQQREELGLPLARHLFPFRQPVVNQVILTISKENALFAMATALPDLMPSLLSMPWFIGEFASDTGFLTVNQVRMAFLIAAASDSPVGFLDQKRQVASIVAGAFGWRAMARELAGKIPFGGGLIPKAAISYAGTYVVGLGLERTDLLTTGFVVVDAAFFALTGLALPLLRRATPVEVRGPAWISAVAIVFALLELLAIAGSVAHKDMRLVALTGLAWIGAAALTWVLFFRRPTRS